MEKGSKVKITAHVLTVHAPHVGKPAMCAFGQIATLDGFVPADHFGEPELWTADLDNGEGHIVLAENEFEELR